MDIPQPVEENWQAVEREHLLAFRALPFAEKLAAVEQMCDLARHLHARAEARRQRAARGAVKMEDGR